MGKENIILSFKLLQHIGKYINLNNGIDYS